MKIFIVLLCLCVQLGFAETPSIKLAAFKKAAQSQSFDATMEQVAKFAPIEGKVTQAQLTQYYDTKINKAIKYFKEGWNFEIIEERIDKDCAVVVINESTKPDGKSFDIDPAYLIKQDGVWRVFPEISDWDIIEGFDKSKVETFKKLEVWFEKRQMELRKSRG